MGTFYSGNVYNNTREFFKQEILAGFNKDLVKVKKSHLSGNIGFVLLESVKFNDEKNDYDRFITVYKIVKNNGEYGYKPMEEDCGPYYYGCPTSILNASNNMSELAVEWRKTNFELLEKKKEAKIKKQSMVRGKIYIVGKRKVMFDFHHKPSRFAGIDIETNELFAFKYDHINWKESEKLEEETISA